MAAKVLWQKLAVDLSKYSESQIAAMLDDEIKTHKRSAIARRLHQRLCKLRSMRERREIMARIKK
jgi:hypothetical protein